MLDAGFATACGGGQLHLGRLHRLSEPDAAVARLDAYWGSSLKAQDILEFLGAERGSRRSADRFFPGETGRLFNRHVRG